MATKDTAPVTLIASKLKPSMMDWPTEDVYMEFTVFITPTKM